MNQVKTLKEVFENKSSEQIPPEYAVPALLMVWGCLSSLKDKDNPSSEIQIAQYGLFRIAMDLGKLSEPEKKDVKKQTLEMIEDLKEFIGVVEASL